MDEKFKNDFKKEVQKSTINGVKKIPGQVWLILPCILIVLLFGYSVRFRLKAEETGGMIGQGTGRLAGRAVGSMEGLTRGQLEGYEAGKSEGLSAKDTTAELSGKIQEVEKLQVLVASGTFSDILTIGKNKEYDVLLSMKYNAVFTVDLGNADIKLENDGLHITLDQPVVDFIPLGEIEKKAEYQKGAFTGSAEAGYDAFNNSANQMREKARSEFQGNESMMRAACASAKTQLTQLVNAVSLSKPQVIIEFREGSNGSID